MLFTFVSQTIFEKIMMKVAILGLFRPKMPSSDTIYMFDLRWRGITLHAPGSGVTVGKTVAAVIVMARLWVEGITYTEHKCMHSMYYTLCCKETFSTLK